jgi:hypothetical protein
VVAHCIAHLELATLIFRKVMAIVPRATGGLQLLELRLGPHLGKGGVVARLSKLRARKGVSQRILHCVRG